MAMQGNNPGNIRLIKLPGGVLPAAFIGEIRPNTAAMRKFANLETGLRAMFHVVISDINKGFDTPKKLIASYAPKGDGKNNPVKYAADVSKAVGMKPTDKISSARLVPMVEAMARIETGKQLPKGIAKKVASNLNNDAYFKALPGSTTGAAMVASGTGVANLLPFWADKKKRTEILTVAGIIGGSYILYIYAKKRKTRSRRAA